MQAVLDTVYQCLPRPTFPGSDLPCGGGKLPVSEEDSLVDRITFLPGDLRRNIVSRLPIKDAARTRILSSQWCQDSSSTPLRDGGEGGGELPVPGDVLAELPVDVDNFSFLPDDLHCDIDIVSRLPVKEAVSQWCQDWSSTPLQGGCSNQPPLPEVDRISFLPDDLRCDIVSRLPVKEAVRTQVLSRQWCQNWSSTPLQGGCSNPPPLPEVDRISFLPDRLRRDIVSRLPIRDAVRTQLLSHQWCHDWTSTLLHLDDGHLLRSSESQRIQRVSRILLAHPGPFRSIRLIFTCFDHHPAALRLWVSLLASKCVEELVLLNRPMPVDIALPIDIMRCTSLRRLYLGFFSFPNTSGHHSVFGKLTELGLYCMVITSCDLSHMLRLSPLLEKLSVVASYGSTEHVNVHGHKKLRSIVICSSVVKEICLQNTDNLDRLILWNNTSGDSRMNVRIDNAPSLRVLGYLEPGVHSLVIGDTVIQVGTKTSPNTVVPSVHVLGLRVTFGDKRRLRMLPAFLRCFPSIDTLHIESIETNEFNGKLNLASWQNMCSDISCVNEHIKKIFIHNLQGGKSELTFLKLFLENARVLEAMVIFLSAECLAQIDDVWEKLGDLGSSNRASENPRLLVTDCSSPLSFEMALDLSTRDPFCTIDDLSKQLQQQVGLAAMDVEPMVMLSSGHEMPVVGLDVWQMVGKTKQYAAICDLMNTALAMGYRHFDCTSDFDAEIEIGKALAEACKTLCVRRKDLFIVTKLPYKISGNVIETCKHTLRNLQLDYVDLYLVSVPHSDGDTDTRISLEITWTAMEELVSMGLVKSIGISNCDIFLIRDLLAYSRTKPVVSQIKIHPYLQRDPLVKFCQTHEMRVMADNLDCEDLESFLKDPVIKVVLRWLLQRSMVVNNPEIFRKEGCLTDLFGFNISAEDMEVILTLDRT